MFGANIDGGIHILTNAFDLLMSSLSQITEIDDRGGGRLCNETPLRLHSTSCEREGEGYACILVEIHKQDVMIKIGKKRERSFLLIVCHVDFAERVENCGENEEMPRLYGREGR